MSRWAKKSQSQSKRKFGDSPKIFFKSLSASATGWYPGADHDSLFGISWMLFGHPDSWTYLQQVNSLNWPVKKFLDGCRSNFIEVSQANGPLTPSNLLPNMTNTLKHSIDFEQMAIQMNSKPYLSEGRTSHVPWWIKLLLDDHLAPYLLHLQRWVFQIFRGPSTLKPIIVKLTRHFSWSW